MDEWTAYSFGISNFGDTLKRWEEDLQEETGKAIVRAFDITELDWADCFDFQGAFETMVTWVLYLLGFRPKPPKGWYEPNGIITWAGHQQFDNSSPNRELILNQKDLKNLLTRGESYGTIGQTISWGNQEKTSNTKEAEEVKGE